MNPLVSICIPVYNVERYIEKCCRTLFEQTYDNIEYIFVDDCTPDNSILVVERILEEYPVRKHMVKFIRHDTNKGVSGARNTGVSAATGEYLLFVDSDDYQDIKAVEYLVRKAMLDYADVVIYDTRFVNSNKSFILHRQVPALKEEVINCILTYRLAPSVCGKLYKTQLIKANGVRFVEGMNYAEDYCTSPRILYYAKKITYCPDCYYNYVQYNTSSSNSYNTKYIDDHIRGIAILNDFFRSKSDFSVYANSIIIAHMQVKIKLLSAICLHRNFIGNRLPMVAGLYKDITCNKGMISTGYRFVLWLAEHKLYLSLYLCINAIFRLKKLKS